MNATPPEPGAPEILPFYTVTEASTLLRIGRTALFDEMRRCRLKYLKRGRSRRIPAEWLAEYRELLKTEALEEMEPHR
jgi:excisionase family DNA binding protein